MQSQTLDRVEATCAHCGAVNRYPSTRAADDPRCGRCKQPLVTSAPVEVGDATWAAEVEGAATPVLVDFWAPWCGPCRAVAPVLEAVAAEQRGRLKVVKVNVDDNPRLAARFGVQAIPTMVLLRKGRLVAEQRGALPKPHLDRWLASQLMQ